MEKGYADLAVLIERPAFDCAKIKQSVREFAFAAMTANRR
jgi:hypothetical protein